MSLIQRLTTSTLTALLLAVSSGETNAQFGSNPAEMTLLTYRVSGGITGAVRTLVIQRGGTVTAKHAWNGKVSEFVGKLTNLEVRSIKQKASAFFQDAPPSGVADVTADMEQYRLRLFALRTSQKFHGLLLDAYGQSLRDRLHQVYGDLVYGDLAESVVVEISVATSSDTVQGLTITTAGSYIRWREIAGVRITLQQVQLTAAQMDILKSFNLAELAKDTPTKQLQYITSGAARQGVRASLSNSDNDDTGPSVPPRKTLLYRIKTWSERMQSAASPTTNDPAGEAARRQFLMALFRQLMR
jgi:hypothetical protein